jgi:multiple sugar transport system permease protein
MAVTQEIPPKSGPRTDPSVATRKRAGRGREGVMGALMVSPAVLLLIVFFFVPVGLCFALAFTNARLISPEPAKVIGFENFTRLFSDPLFWKSLRNTFYFAVVVVPLQSGFALLLALLVNAKIRGINFFRTLYFVPVVTSIVVVSILWKFMYQPDGLVNNLLQTLTFNVVQGTDWLNNPTAAMPAIMFMSIWQAVGFHMVIWLSGLQTIPGELYEASELDSADKWQQFRYVTWPGLKATRTFILVTITIAAPVRPDQRDDPGRPAGPDLDGGVPGGAGRLWPAGDGLRLDDLAGVLPAGADRLARAALPHP